jgi:hypothetical protein
MALDRTWYNTLVNDDGSGLTGSIWDKEDVNQLMNAIDAQLASPGVAGYPWVDYTAGLHTPQGPVFSHGGAYTRYQQFGQNAKTILVQYSIEAMTFSANATELWVSFPFTALAWAGAQMFSVPLFINGVYETGWLSIAASNTSYATIGRNGGQQIPAGSGIYFRGTFIYRAQ